MCFKSFTRLFLLIGMMGLFLASAVAQGQTEVVEIGEATTTTTLAPIYTPHDYSYTQQLYTAEEIGASGTITSIAFHWAYNGSKTFGIDVYMKHTDKNYFESSSDRIPISSSDMVYSGTITPDAEGWINITLDTPFEYDGSNSLVIAVDRNSGSPGFNDLDNNWNVIGTWYYTSTDNYTMLYNGGSTNVDPNPSFMTPSNNRPNIQIEIASSTTTCKAPKNLAASDITTNSATLTWTAGSEDQTDWDVYFTTSNAAPDENTTPTFQVTECTKALTGLTAQTTYYAYVRAACSSTDKSRWISTTFTTTREALHVGPGDSYETDFESSCDWAFTNGTLTNQWCWGSATNNGGEKAMYISNDNGTSNAYTASNAAVVFASKLFSFDPGTYTFVYDWKANGESTYDYLRVALVPGDMEFTASTSLPSNVGTTTLPTGWIALDGGGKLNLASSWQNQTCEATVSGTYTMVFLWRDDTSGGSQPPAAIDNVSISMMTCPRPTSLVVDATTLTWTPGDEGQDAWEISLGTTTNPEDGTIITVTGTPSYTFTDLALETQYYAYVRSDCGMDGKSSWSEAATLYLGYCQPAPTSVDKKGITNVTFGTGDEIVNNSNYPNSSPYYGNYSNLVGAVAASETAIVNITYETGYTYGTLIWVDWNNNYELEDSEIVYSGTSTNSNPTTLEASFTIPATQAEGYYRMRIGGADSYFDGYIGGNATANHDPCSAGTYKVFHDYTLHVLPVPACPTPTAFAASNVAATTATLSWTENGTSTSWVLQYGTDDSFADFTEITNGFSADGNTISIDLSGLTAEAQYYARVKAINGSDESGWVTCTFTTLPTCAAPTSLSATKTGTSITLSWTAGAEGQDAWDIRYKQNSDAEYLYIHLENHPTTSYTITPLSPVTAYNVNVRAWCDEDDQSKWGYNANNQDADLSVTTECGALTIPYACDFEGALETSQSTNYPMPKCWTRIAYQGGYPGSYTYYPSVRSASYSQPYAHGGNGESATSGKSLHFYKNNTSTDEAAVLPEIDEQYTITDLQISFWARLESYQTNKDLSIGVMTDPSDLTTFTEVATVTVKDATFQEYTAFFDNYEGDGHYIAIRFNSSTAGYIFVDDILIDDAPRCFIPKDLEAASVNVDNAILTWTEGKDEIAWNVQYKKTTDSEWSSPITVDETTYTLTGLERATEYEVRVQSNCDAENQSEWTYPITFTTECGIWPIDVDNTLFENFDNDNYSFPPICWTAQPDYNGWSTSFNNAMVNDQPEPHGAAHSGTMSNGLVFLILPPMHIDGNATLSFDHLFGTLGEATESSIAVTSLTGTFDEFTPVIWTADEENLPDTRTHVTVSLAAYDGQDIQVAFKYDGQGTDSRTWYIDNVMVSVDASQTIALTAGWNWVSFNVEITLNDLKEAILAAEPGDSPIIKSKSKGQTSYNGAIWTGALKTLDLSQMYEIKVANDCTITLEGSPINPADHPITITNGANWIAFPLGTSMSISDAFAGFASEGDFVKSKTNGQATWNGMIWGGQLKNLEPGKGYIYNSSTTTEKTFTFPSSNK